MNLPSDRYYDLEFASAPCPTVQEEMELDRVVAEGERLLRGQRAWVIVAWMAAVWALVLTFCFI